MKERDRETERTTERKKNTDTGKPSVEKVNDRERDLVCLSRPKKNNSTACF